MIIELNFTDEEMILFLAKRHIIAKKEERCFDSSDIFSTESKNELKSVWIVRYARYTPVGIYKGYTEIMVADEKNYQSKSSVLKETFIKELKKSLLNL